MDTRGEHRVMKLIKFKKGGGNYAVFYCAGFFLKKICM
jgi:hypothetical protein